MPLLPPVISAVFPSSLPMCASMRSVAECRLRFGFHCDKTRIGLSSGAIDFRCICAYIVCMYSFVKDQSDACQFAAETRRVQLFYGSLGRATRDPALRPNPGTGRAARDAV